jgi:hypothetical protein
MWATGRGCPRPAERRTRPGRSHAVRQIAGSGIAGSASAEMVLRHAERARTAHEPCKEKPRHGGAGLEESLRQTVNPALDGGGTLVLRRGTAFSYRLKAAKAN